MSNRSFTCHSHTYNYLLLNAYLLKKFDIEGCFSGFDFLLSFDKPNVRTPDVALPRKGSVKDISN